MKKKHEEYFQAGGKPKKSNIDKFKDRCHAKLLDLLDKVPRGPHSILEICAAPGGFAFAFTSDVVNNYVAVSSGDTGVKFYDGAHGNP